MTMSTEAPRKWPEHAYVEETLPKYGSRYVAEKLEKPLTTVRSYAERHGIKFGDYANTVPLRDLAKATGTPYNRLYNIARRSNILRRVGPPPRGNRHRPVVVPVRWADKVLEDSEVQSENDELVREAGWLTVQEAATQWKTSMTTVMNALDGRGALARLVKHENVRTSDRRLKHRRLRVVIEPHSAERVRRRIEQDAERAKELIWLPDLAHETNRHPSLISTLSKRHGGREVLFVNSRNRIYVTHETADEIRNYLRNNPARRKNATRNPEAS